MNVGGSQRRPPVANFHGLGTRWLLDLFVPELADVELLNMDRALLDDLLADFDVDDDLPVWD